MADKKNWCFVYQNFITGGLETYVYRMAKYLIEKGNSVAVICETMSQDMKTLFLNTGVNIRYFKRWDRKEFCKQLKNVDIFISFSLHDYFYIKLFSKRALSIMYCVHDYHLTFQDREDRYLNYIRRVVFKNVIKYGISNNTIMIMNDKYYQSICDFYNLKIDKACISYLPYEIKKMKSCANCDENKLNILTVCRADFPFKGYVIGLIDDFVSLKNNDIFLTIISYGEGIDEIKKHIGTCSNIKLVEGVHYDELENYYLDANIYIGMGSTLIEAASYAVPAINANSYDMTFKSTGFFFENPHAKRNTDLGIVDGKQLLLELIKMGNVERNEMGEKCYDTFMKYFSIKEHYKKINRIYDKEMKLLKDE